MYYLVAILSLILIGYHVPCSEISLASGICHLIFIGSLTVPTSSLFVSGLKGSIFGRTLSLPSLIVIAFILAKFYFSGDGGGVGPGRQKQARSR